jgi:hypothetical protein
MGAGNEDSSYMQEVQNCVGLATASKLIAELESSDEGDQSECRLALAALSRVIATKLENLNAALHETYVTLSERARIAKKKR